MGGGAVPASVARSPSPRALCATQRRVGTGRRPVPGGAQEQPEPGPIRGPGRTRPSKPALAEASPPLSEGPRRRAPGPRVRGRCRWRDRDAKTDGRLQPIRKPLVRGTPGDRHSPTTIRRSRGVPRPPQGFRDGSRSQPADRPAVLRARIFRGLWGCWCFSRLFDRSETAQRGAHPKPHPEGTARGDRFGPSPVMARRSRSHPALRIIRKARAARSPRCRSR